MKVMGRPCKDIYKVHKTQRGYYRELRNKSAGCLDKLTDEKVTELQELGEIK